MYDYHEHRVSRTLDAKVKKSQQPSISDILRFQNTVQLVKIDEFDTQTQNRINSQEFKDFLLTKRYATCETFHTRIGYRQWLMNRTKQKIMLYIQEFNSQETILDTAAIQTPSIPVPVPEQVTPLVIEPEDIVETDDSVHNEFQEEETEQELPLAAVPDDVPMTTPTTASAVIPIPSSTPLLPAIDTWDTDRDFHKATRSGLVPFYKRWKELPDKASTIRLPDAITHLKMERRYFSHEMMSQYLDFAISQGGLQSGYRTTKALGLQNAKHDQGKVQHDFVFTRQLPSKRMGMTLADGQVGSGADAMVVLSPTMFEDPNQITFFKMVDGAHHNPLIIPPKLRKGDHIVSQSDTIAKSADKIFHGNQEQGVQGVVSLKHFAGIILKASPGADLEGIKREFIQHLQQTPASSLLPPKAIRDRIKNLPLGQQQQAYDQWKVAEGRKSLYEILTEGLNRDLTEGEEGRTVESIIHVLKAAETKRSEVVDKIGL